MIQWRKNTPTKQEIECRIFGMIESADEVSLPRVLESISEEIVMLWEYTYYIPSANSYFTLELDGNYYHGYDLFVHKQTKSELEHIVQLRMEREKQLGIKPLWPQIYERLLMLPQE